jgi:hypothetical protein
VTGAQGLEARGSGLEAWARGPELMKGKFKERNVAEPIILEVFSDYV